MAHFYGKVEGRGKTPATRLGTKTSGVQTLAASYEGAIKVSLWRNLARGEDWTSVWMTKWQGEGSDHLIYRGPVSRMEHTIG